MSILDQNNVIFFVHLPKTAGTSFRRAADVFWGKGGSCRDYGANSEETSSIIRESFADNFDPWRFIKSFNAQEYSFFCGHVQARKYIHLFGAERTVTFLRDPVRRIISEYNHFVRHNNYKRGFEEFYRTKQFINKQHGMLQGIPWPALGFIGITECYGESLDLFNDRFGVDFTRLEENLSRKTIKEDYKLTPDQERELCQLNSEDILLYRQAYRQFEWRIRLAKENRVFTRGMITAFNNRRLRGWAVYDEGDAPVKVEILVNGKSVGSAVSCEVRPQLQALGLRRGGFVGFTLELPKLDIGDEVEAFVTDTGQPLANSPWLYSGS